MFGGVKRSSLFHKGLNYRNRYFYCKCLSRTNFITSACAFKTILNPGVINQCVCHCRTLPTKFKLCLGLGPFKAVPEICGSGKRPSLLAQCIYDDSKKFCNARLTRTNSVTSVFTKINHPFKFQRSKKFVEESHVLTQGTLKSR
jgi:hypothetical protein